MERMTFYCLLVALLSFQACDEQTGYDAAKAKELGADQYGMRTYVMALLRPGTAAITDSVQLTEIQRGHLDHIQKMAENGMLALAGPFYTAQPYSGLFIFNTDSLEEAEAWVAKDPAVISGRLEADLHLWYGSAALQEVGALHKRIEQLQP